MNMDEHREQLITRNAERLAVSIEAEYKPGMTLEELRTFLKSKGFGIEATERAIAIWYRDFSTRPEEPKTEEKKEPIGGKYRLLKFSDIPDDFLYADSWKVCLAGVNPAIGFVGMDRGKTECGTTYSLHYIPQSYIKTKAKILGTQRDQRVFLLDMPKALEEKFSKLGTLKKLNDFVDLYTLKVFIWNDLDDAITFIKEAEVPLSTTEKIEIKPLTWHHMQVSRNIFSIDCETGDLSDLRMSKEPKMKRRLAVVDITKADRFIYIDADKEYTGRLKKYGSVNHWTDNPDRYQIRVDWRYDFNEVVDEIRKLEKESVIA